MGALRDRMVGDLEPGGYSAETARIYLRSPMWRRSWRLREEKVVPFPCTRLDSGKRPGNPAAPLCQRA